MKLPVLILGLNSLPPPRRRYRKKAPISEALKQQAVVN